MRRPEAPHACRDQIVAAAGHCRRLLLRALLWAGLTLGAAGTHAAQAAEHAGGSLPCPQGWTVAPNASVENSLSYAHLTQNLAVSVSYIAARAGPQVSPERYARVAAQKMLCSMPVMSNLIAGAWTFTCKELGVETVIYGPPGNLVMLAIAGRSADTEPLLEDFIRFLAAQARH